MHLYIHVPFCGRRCSYCDFAIAVRREVPSAAFAAAIEREWAGWQRHPAWEASPVIDTVYFGGGTPSKLDPAAIARMLQRFRAERGLSPGAEVTLEANPEDVDAARATAWVAAGVNRVSLGSQSFEPKVLEWMHRTHGVAQIGHAVEVLRGAGVADLSLDLIFGLPAALARDWGGDVDRALALAPTHLSLYGLTVEPHTPLGKWTARGATVPADDDRAAAEYLVGHARLLAAGFEHYEVSNAGLPGYRARHNAAYWARAPFIGLGPSAHSAFQGTRSWNVREWEDYRRRNEAGQETTLERETLSAAQVRLEELYLGLRTSGGFSASRMPETVTRRWVEEGWAAIRGPNLVLSPEGWLRLDALVASVSHY